MDVQIGIIGGSGLYKMDALQDIEEVVLDTPFGSPSDAYIVGTLEGVRVAFLPRHGRGHFISPTELPSRANIYGFKQLGVRRIIAVSACGSLKEEIAPQHIGIPDQLFDRTRHRRPDTFFGDGCVAHIGFADPFCPTVRKVLLEAARKAGATVHDGGTLVVMEGPAFSTKAESAFYRQAGFSYIGMTALPEAKLAREAEICYAILNLVTDYDVWHPEHDQVTVEMVVQNLLANVATAQRILQIAVPKLAALGEPEGCPCPTALANALITDPKKIPAETKERLNLLIGKYLA